MSDWDELNTLCSECRRCALCDGRKNAVLGRGNLNAPVLMIGEGPGEHEDRLGQPFVGPAGKLLDNLIKALKIDEDKYYITNIVKCRPPANRTPFDEEAQACLPFLRRQFQLIKPQIIVCLGATAMKYIADEDAKITQIRGTWIEKKGTYIMPTFHPLPFFGIARRRFFCGVISKR